MFSVKKDVEISIHILLRYHMLSKRDTKANISVLLICLACEWQGYLHSPQNVSLEIDEKKRLQIYGENGSPVRAHNLGNQDLLEVFLSNDHQHRALLLRIPKEYDLVRNNYAEHLPIFKYTTNCMQ